jgi:hypothetical protein
MVGSKCAVSLGCSAPFSAFRASDGLTYKKTLVPHFRVTFLLEDHDRQLPIYRFWR